MGDDNTKLQFDGDGAAVRGLLGYTKLIYVAPVQLELYLTSV